MTDTSISNMKFSKALRHYAEFPLHVDLST
jgi:hypothetical protein